MCGDEFTIVTAVLRCLDWLKEELKRFILRAYRPPNSFPRLEMTMLQTTLTALSFAPLFAAQTNHMQFGEEIVMDGGRLGGRLLTKVRARGF